jgi:hypothetical protein
MLDNTADPIIPPNDKTRLTPKPKPDPTPVGELLSDGTLRVVVENLNPLEAQRLLLNASVHITAQFAQQNMLSLRVLSVVRAKFDGFDEETERAMNVVLGAVAPS